MASNNLSSGPATAFLRLPTELRFQVYDHLFADSSFWISRKFKELSVPPTPPLPFSTPSDYSINNEGCQHRHQILLACRSIHDEAHALWSTFTIWTLPDQHVLRAFLRPSSGLLPGLKHLHLTSPGISDLSPELQLDWLESLPGLETLTIDVPLTICYWEREQSSAKIYEDTQNSILQLPINPRRQQTDTELHSVVQQVFGLPRRRFALVVAVETFYYVPSLCCRTLCHVNLDDHSIVQHECCGDSSKPVVGRTDFRAIQRDLLVEQVGRWRRKRRAGKVGRVGVCVGGDTGAVAVGSVDLQVLEEEEEENQAPMGQLRRELLQGVAAVDMQGGHEA